MLFYRKLCIVCVALNYASFATGKVYLEPLSTIYLPSAYDSIEWQLWDTSVKQNAFDPTDKLIYTVGSNIIHVLDASDTSSLTEIYHVTLDDVQITDVELCGNYIFTTQDNLDVRENGTVVIYKKYNRNNNTLTEALCVTVGYHPEMLRLTSDCRKIIVAIEGEAFMVGFDIIDPEGGIGIIEFDPEEKTGNYTLVDFKKFNSRVEEYISRGVRFVYRDNNNTFSQDLEPEYITLNHDESLAYVTLQENNAIAVFNIAQKSITEIYGLGEKAWNDTALDASDYDYVINIKPWNIYSTYLPDAIEYLRFNGEGYILSANEGEDKSYHSWYEEERVNSLVKGGDIGSPALEMLSSLNDDMRLGRLVCSNVDGVDPSSGLITKLYTYGGRSFSVWRASDMSLVYDSGDEMERRMAEFYPSIFNANGIENHTPSQTRDTRSDNKGPECEMVTTAEFNGKQVIFIGNERPGTIAIFSFTTDITDIRFDSIYSGLADQNTLKTWEELYEDDETGDMDPEDIRFIPATDSPNGEPLLLVAGAVSGTVSLYAVKDTDPPPTMPPPPRQTDPTTGDLQSGSRADEGQLVIIILGICINLKWTL